MRVLVCGSRDADPSLEAELIEVLCDINAGDPLTAIIHGGAPGPDRWGSKFARRLGIEEVTVLAFWGRYGGRAGPIRNQQMIDEYAPDRVVAVWDGKSRGTADMIRRAEKASLPVSIIRG